MTPLNSGLLMISSLQICDTPTVGPREVQRGESGRAVRSGCVEQAHRQDLTQKTLGKTPSGTRGVTVYRGCQRPGGCVGQANERPLKGPRLEEAHAFRDSSRPRRRLQGRDVDRVPLRLARLSE